MEEYKGREIIKKKTCGTIFKKYNNEIKELPLNLSHIQSFSQSSSHVWWASHYTY